MFLLQGFALSALLLYITHVLYKIPFQHAASGVTVHNVKIPAIDGRIPVIPIFFFGYIWSYVYWFFAPFFVLKAGKDKVLDLIVSFTLSLLVCSLIQYFFPTKIDRVAEGLWDPSLHGFFWELLHICYNVDGGSVSYNLLPSMHCANCVLYYMAMRDSAAPRRFLRAALASSVLVVLSALFTKQHFFLDAVTGIMIPIPVTFFVRKTLRRLRSGVGKEAPAAPGPSSES